MSRFLASLIKGMQADSIPTCNDEPGPSNAYASSQGAGSPVALTPTSP